MPSSATSPTSSMTVPVPLPPSLALPLHHHQHPLQPQGKVGPLRFHRQAEANPPPPRHRLEMQQALDASNYSDAGSSNMALTWRHTSIQVWADSHPVPFHLMLSPSASASGGGRDATLADPVSTAVAVARMHLLDHHQLQLTLATANTPPALVPVAEKHTMLAAIVSTSPARTPTTASDWSPPICARNMTLPGTYHAVPLPSGIQCVRVEYWPVTANGNGPHTGRPRELKCAQATPVHVVVISFAPPVPLASTAGGSASMPPPSHTLSHSTTKLAHASNNSTVFIRPTTPASALNSARRTHANMQLTRSALSSPRPPSPKAPNVLLSRDAYVLNRRGMPLPMIPPSMLGHATWVPPPPGAPKPTLKLITNHSGGGDADAGGDQNNAAMGNAGQMVAFNPDAPYWSRAGGGTWRPWSVSPHPSMVHSFDHEGEVEGEAGHEADGVALFGTEHDDTYVQAMAMAISGAPAQEPEGSAAAGCPSDEDLAMFQRYLMASQEPSELPSTQAPPSLLSVSSRDVLSSSASVALGTASPRAKSLALRSFPPPSSATPNGSPVGSSMNTTTPPNPGTSSFGSSPPGADRTHPQFMDGQQQQQHPRREWSSQQMQQQYAYPPPTAVSAESSPSMGNELSGSTRRQAQANRYRPYPSFSGSRVAGARQAQAMQH